MFEVLGKSFDHCVIECLVQQDIFADDLDGQENTTMVSSSQNFGSIAREHQPKKLSLQVVTHIYKSICYDAGNLSSSGGSGHQQSTKFLRSLNRSFLPPPNDDSWSSANKLDIRSLNQLFKHTFFEHVSYKDSSALQSQLSLSSLTKAEVDQGNIRRYHTLPLAALESYTTATAQQRPGNTDLVDQLDLGDGMEAQLLKALMGGDGADLPKLGF